VPNKPTCNTSIAAPEERLFSDVGILNRRGADGNPTTKISLTTLNIHVVQ